MLRTRYQQPLIAFLVKESGRTFFAKKSLASRRAFPAVAWASAIAPPPVFLFFSFLSVIFRFSGPSRRAFPRQRGTGARTHDSRDTTHGLDRGGIKAGSVASRLAVRLRPVSCQINGHRATTGDDHDLAGSWPFLPAIGDSFCDKSEKGKDSR